jgi:hypothetical protein
MAGALVYLILFFFVFVRLVNSKKTKGSGNTASRSSANRTSGRSPMASDGHRVPKDQDISCRRYGHKHEEFDTPRFIPHEDPEQGYIILNGVRMKLTEADNYENRI